MLREEAIQLQTTDGESNSPLTLWAGVMGGQRRATLWPTPSALQTVLRQRAERLLVGDDVLPHRR